MSTLDELFRNNRSWAEEMLLRAPDFFERLSRQQAPQYMWIGCSDSRVPANQIVGLAPGELYVHRNVANVVVHSDLNCLASMQYAVDVLRVRHVIVCGHYGCGGVRAALESARYGLVDNWIRHVKDVAEIHRVGLAGAESHDARVDALCELNVIEQVRNVAQSTVVQDAWSRGAELTVHGLVYGVENGLLKDLKTGISSPRDVDSSYEAAIAQAPYSLR